MSVGRVGVLMEKKLSVGRGVGVLMERKLSVGRRVGVLVEKKLSEGWMGVWMEKKLSVGWMEGLSVGRVRALIKELRVASAAS